MHNTDMNTIVNDKYNGIDIDGKNPKLKKASITCNRCGDSTKEVRQGETLPLCPLCSVAMCDNIGWVGDAGVKHDEGKLPYHLIPFDALAGTVEVLAFGANKYAERNWENGIDYHRVYSAMMRHMTTWWMGEDCDDETGMSHLDHASCCVMFLQAFVKRGRNELDDRPNTNRE